MESLLVRHDRQPLMAIEQISYHLFMHRLDAADFDEQKPAQFARLDNREIRHDECLALRPTLDELFDGVTDKRSRNERIHAAVRAHQYKLKEVGDHLGLCYSTVSVIAKRIDEELKP